MFTFVGPEKTKRSRRYIAIGLLASALGVAWLSVVARDTAKLPSVPGAPPESAAPGLVNGKVPANGGLTVREEDLDFGEVYLQDGFVWTVPVHNPTEQPISIRDFSATCLCAKAKTQLLTVPAKKTLPVTFKLDLSPRNPAHASFEKRNYETWVSPQIPGVAKSGPGWRIHGLVRNLVQFTPISVNFGDSLIYGRPYESRTLHATCRLPATSLDASCDASMGTVVTTPANSTGSEFDIQVTPATSLPAGAFTFSVVLRPKAADGRKLPGVPIPVSGEILEDAYVLPSTLILRPTGTEGRTGEFQVLTRSPGRRIARVETTSEQDSILHVSAISSGGDNTRFCAEVIDHKQGIQFLRVRLRVWYEGEADAMNLYVSVVLDGRGNSQPKSSSTGSRQQESAGT